MKGKLIKKYIIIYMPVICGGILFFMGSINLASSLLLFLGGYIAIKNTFDYRIVKKNMDKVNTINETKKECNTIRESSGVEKIKKVKRNIRVRIRKKE